MKFKVGDRVRVKTNLKGGERYGDMYFHADMEEYRGKEYTVIAIDRCGYYLEGVGRLFGPWSFRDEMLDPAILPVKRDWTLIVRPDKADPDKTTAVLKVDGKETRRETAKRYHKDEYGIESAIKAAVTKLIYPNGCVITEGTLKPADGGLKTVEIEAAAKEVKRHAEVGEWIKIIEPIATGGHYGHGDIMRVIEKSPVNGIARVSTCDGKYPVSDEEYVVLEGYNPESAKADEPVIGQPANKEPANNAVHKKQYTLTITDSGDNTTVEGKGDGFNAHEIIAAIEYHKFALMTQTTNKMEIKTGDK